MSLLLLLLHYPLSLIHSTRHDARFPHLSLHMLAKQKARMKTSHSFAGMSWLIRQFLDYGLAPTFLSYWISHSQIQSPGLILDSSLWTVVDLLTVKASPVTSEKSDLFVPSKVKVRPMSMFQRTVLTLRYLKSETKPLEKWMVSWVRVEKLPM